MTEFDLIEASRRFRKLEDLAEEADLILAGKQNLMASKNPVEAERIEILRADIDTALESCRSDLGLMQELIRGSL